jgi:lysophospholipase L1-like esterase
MRQRIFPLIIGTLGTLLAGVCANAQLADEFNPPTAACCLTGVARNLADQLQDWNQIGRYHQADQELKKQPGDPRRVVFMGDSITDFWRLADYFPGQPYVDRGISGQTTPQMLARMYADVIDLKPAAMIVLAGTNDIAHNTGPVTAEMIEENIMAMTELAQGHGIKVILCSVTPVSDYPFRKQQSAPPAPPVPGQPPQRPRARMTVGRPPADILKINAWMKDYAARVHAVYADYFTALVDEKGWLKEPVSADGLHPNAEGYKIMAPIAEAAIEKALR